MDARVLCVIPAKERSERLPGKNLRPLAGRPLLAHTLAHARESRWITHAVVSTDSPAIRELCRAEGVDAPFLRAPELCAPDVHASAAVIDALERLGGAERWTHCVMLLPTSPLRPPGTVDAVIERSVRSDENVLTVTRLGKSLLHLRTVDADGRLEAVTADRRVNVQTGDAPELVYLDGSVQCAPSAALLAHRTYHYKRPVGFVLEPGSNVDVDTEADLVLAARLLAGAEARPS